MLAAVGSSSILQEWCMQLLHSMSSTYLFASPSWTMMAPCLM
jgi:hypothetical protein